MKRVFAKIKFISIEDGGRLEPLPDVNFGCPVFFESHPLLGNGRDCRLLISEYGKKLYPGETFENVPMVFVWEEDVLPFLRIGARFTLWEGKVIAQGEVQRME